MTLAAFAPMAWALMLRDAVGRLRAVGWCEGASFLLLVGVAMPLKYLADYPFAVRVVGWIHGILFIAYCFALFEATGERGWPWKKSGKLLVAALLPFGPFVVDRGLREEHARTAQ